jgi:hypothetical protein
MSHIRRKPHPRNAAPARRKPVGKPRSGGGADWGSIARRGLRAGAGAAADAFLPGWVGRAGRAIGVFGGMPKTLRTEQPTSKSFMPSAVNTITRSYYKTASAPLHPEYGVGLRIIACQFLTNTDATSGKADGFASGVAAIAISPDAIGGPVATDARNYSYYAFRSLKFHFISNMPASDTFRQAFAYFPDSAIATFSTVNFSTMQSTQDSVVTPRRQNCTLVASPYTGSKVWFSEIDATSSASLRQTEQGVLYSYLNANETATQTTGEVLLEYVLDLYGRSPDYNFSLGFPNPATAVKALQLLDENKVQVCRRDRLRLESSIKRHVGVDIVLPACTAICDASSSGVRAAVETDGRLNVGGEQGTAVEVNITKWNSTAVKDPIAGAPSVVVADGAGNARHAFVSAAGSLEVHTNASSTDSKCDVMSSGELNRCLERELRKLDIKGGDSKYRSRLDEDKFVHVPPCTPQGSSVRLERTTTR